MRLAIIFLSATVGSALGSCAQRVPHTAAESAQATPGTIACIDSQAITARRITGPLSLEFDAAGVTYRNNLYERCPGLNHGANFKIIALEVDASRVCAGDSFRVVDAAEAKAVGTQVFGQCRLGLFTPIPAH